MTADRDLGRQLGTWLEESAASVMPDGLLERSLGRVGRTRQRPALLVPDRWALPRRRDVAAGGWSRWVALVAGLAAVVLGVALLSPGGSLPSIGTLPTLTATPTETPSPSRSSIASPSPYPCGQGPGTCRGALAPGSYVATAFRPRIGYTVPASWINDLDVRSMLVLLDAAGGSFTYPDGITFRDGVYLYRDPVAESAVARTPLAGIGKTASDLARWLDRRTDLDATGLAPVTIDGVRGFRIEVATPEGDRTSPDHCTADHGVSRCASLFLSDIPDAKPGGPDWFGFGIVGPESAVIYVLDAPSGDTVMVVIDDVDGVDRDGLITAATPIVNNLDFTP